MAAAVEPYGVRGEDFHVEVMGIDTFHWERVGPDFPTKERAAAYGREVVEGDFDGAPWRVSA